MHASENIFHIVSPAEGELFDTLLQCKNVKIERIVSADVDPHKIYVQEQNEWVILLKGTARLELKGKVAELCEGDYVFIPAHTPHMMLQTNPDTIWLAVHIY